MKHLRTLGAVAILLLAMAVPSKSTAQSPALYHSERFNKFLNEHQRLKAHLAANPDLVYDRRFREEHPELRQFLQNHPNVWQKIGRGPNMGPGGARGWGDYDTNDEWHDADWWHEHDRAWMYRHHPEWAEDHPDWRAEDGDFDDARVWHDRDWWNENHRDWVERQHPNWFKHQQHDAWKDQEHAEHEAYKEQRHAQHEAFKDQQQQEKHGHYHGGHGDHDND